MTNVSNSDIGTIFFVEDTPKSDTSCNKELLVNKSKLQSNSNWESVKSSKCIEHGYFEYKDEDGDIIKGNSELEWKAMISTAERIKCFNVNIVATKVRDTRNLCPAVEQLTVSQKQDNSKCGEGKSSCCPDYNRPMPDAYKDDGKPLIKKVNKTLNEYKYTGDALMAVALPLGALGGGSIAIAGDGGLRQWQISNKVNHTSHFPNSFFAIKIDKSCYALQSSTLYDQSKFKAAPYITDHEVPKASIDLLKKVHGVKTVEITAKYPVVEVDYKDPAINSVAIHMEAWSPTIPLDPQTTAMPVIFFEFQVSNVGQKPVEISLLGSLHNMVGYDGYSTIEDDASKCYGGNENTQTKTGLFMTNPSLDKLHAFNGKVSLFTLPAEHQNKSFLVQYDKIEMLWEAFQANSTLPGQGKKGPSPAGHTYHGAVNLTQTVAGGTTAVFTYALAWHFPNRFKDWSVDAALDNSTVFVGNHYAKLWPELDAVVDAATKDYAHMKQMTYKFRDDLFSKCLPWQLVDSVAGRISVLNSPSCMWHFDGNFYVYEGCSIRSGCCPLNCTHVLNYEMTLAHLFPSVERTMREIDLMHQINPHGVIPSRTNCPLKLRRVWNNWKNYTTSPDSTQICVDGEIGTVLKVYREVRLSGDLNWLRNIWDPVKLTMNRWLNDLDTDKCGMIYGAQPNTYDVATYGYCIFIGLLYLCALRAASEMALLLKEQEFSNICMQRFLLGSKNLDEKCYNGQYYVQVVDPNHSTNLMTDATFVGFMYGQWWANMLDLGYLLPKEHIRSHLMQTYKRNYVEKFDPDSQKPRKFADERDSGWRNGFWCPGKEPQNSLYYAHEIAWSGIIYTFAAMLLKENYLNEALKVLQLTREFYDGTRRSPWNEIECGDHYMRALSSYSLLPYASGQQWSMAAGYNCTYNLCFAPIINIDEFRCFMTIPNCWGTYGQEFKQKTGAVDLSLSYGSTTLAQFGFIPASTLRTVSSVTVAGKKVSYKTSKVTNYIIIIFDKPVQLEACQQLAVRLTT